MFYFTFFTLVLTINIFYLDIKGSVVIGYYIVYHMTDIIDGNTNENRGVRPKIQGLYTGNSTV